MSPLLVTVCFKDGNTVVIKVVGQRAKPHRMLLRQLSEDLV